VAQLSQRGPWLRRPSGLLAPDGGGGPGAGLSGGGLGLGSGGGLGGGEEEWLRQAGLEVPREIRDELYFLTQEKVWGGAASGLASFSECTQERSCFFWAPLLYVGKAGGSACRRWRG
jgi:hypothetical protein